MLFHVSTDLFLIKMLKNYKNNSQNLKMNLNCLNVPLNHKPTIKLLSNQTLNSLKLKDLIKLFLGNKLPEPNKHKFKNNLKHPPEPIMKKINPNHLNHPLCLIDKKSPEYPTIPILLI
jgi:hypothetical protein